MTKDDRQRPGPLAPPRELLELLEALPSLTPGRRVRRGPSSSVASSTPGGAGAAPSSRALLSPEGAVPENRAAAARGSGFDSRSVQPPPLEQLVVDEELVDEEQARPELPPASRELRRREARRARRARMAAKLDAAGARGTRPRDFSRAVLGSVPAILASTSGAVARDRLARLPRWFARPVFALAVCAPDGRQHPDTLQHVWSRLIVACAVLLWRSRRTSERNGYAWVVDGFTQKMILRLLVNAQTGEAYSRSRIFSPSFRKGSDECGPMYALRAAGLYWRQPRTVDADPRFLGRERTRIVAGVETRFRPAFAVYWLAGPDGPA